MKIHIYEKCIPFSHRPGTRCYLPGTAEIITAFPAKINNESLDIQGPVKEWTFFQDLEKGKIVIRGLTAAGLFLREIKGVVLSQKAKLSFGVHKAQNLDKIKERAAPEEFLPFWFALGQYFLTNNHTLFALQGSPSLLGDDSLLRTLYDLGKLELYQAWQNLFRAGFDDWFIPRTVDKEFHGFNKNPVDSKDPSILLSGGAALILQMFLQTDCSSFIDILPKLPPQLHCGKIVDLVIPELGVISLEWSKKEIKKIIFTPSKSGELLLTFPKSIASYRVTSKCGTSRQTIEKPLKIEKNEVIYFDQFQH